MKFNFKRAIANVLLSSVAFTTACGAVPEEGVPVLKNFRNTDHAAVVSMIDAISEATFETESNIEAAFAAYYALEGDSRAQVTNFEKLVSLREGIADLYEDKTRQGTRVDRSKILIGTYCVNYWDEAHVKDVADCGIDFIAAAGYSQEFMDNLSKYGVGAFVSCGNFGYPMWKGGDRPFGSTVSGPSFTVDDFAAAGNVVDHEAIWGIELVDEPHSDDMYFHGELTAKLLEKHPEYQVYNNLFPNYANEKQLGTWTYEEHVQDYVENFDLDYISYDHYPYDDTPGFELWMENLRIVADAGRANNKDYWVVTQANNQRENVFTSIEQLRMQVNTALAFGYTVINWACWNPGWFYNNICDANGNKTEQYDKVKQVNAEINQLSPVFMKYKNLDANIIGYENRELGDFYVKDDNAIDQDIFTDFQTAEKTESAVLCGYFEKRIGEGNAMMFVNISDFVCEKDAQTWVKFKVADAEAIVTEHTTAGSFVLHPDSEGYYKVTVANAEYSFVTVEKASVAVETAE